MEKNEMFSCNSEFSEFDLQQLEDRLETDPLAVGGLMDLSTTASASCWLDLDCPNLSSCDLTC